MIETRHFNMRMASIFMRAAAYGRAENMVFTERFTRVGEQAMEYEFILDDPSTFTDQIRGIVHFSRLNASIYEFACHEGNYALTNMLRGKRLEELRAEGYAR